MNKVILTEKWKPVAGYEEYYEVSSEGRIRSLTRGNGHGDRIILDTPKYLKLSKATTGCLKIKLMKPGERKDFKVHRLVAAAFIPNPLKLPCVNHIDENPHNNNTNNLEWCTQSENVRHSELFSRNHKKLSVEQELDVISSYKSGEHGTRLARQYGVSTMVIYGTLRRFDIRRRCGSAVRDKYGIDMDYFKRLVDSGVRNRDIALKLGCPTDLVATRKYQYKKGVI